MNKRPIDSSTWFMVLIPILLLGVFVIFVSNIDVVVANKVTQTEICEVVAHDQVIRSPQGETRVAIIKRGNGELRHLLLDSVLFRSNYLNGIPAEVKYVYVSGLNVTNKEPSSLVLIFPKS